MALVRIEIDGFTAKVYSSYDPGRVDIIKSIPGRRWDKDGKFWEIPTGQVPSLKVALEAIGDAIVISGQAEQPPRSDDGEVRRLREENQRLQRDKQRIEQQIIRMRNEAAAANGRNWAEQLLGACDPDLADKVFKRLTAVLHPDAGGHDELMKQLNVARDLLNARSYR